MTDQAREGSDIRSKESASSSATTENTDGLSNSAPQSRSTKLEKQGKDAITQTTTPQVEIDTSDGVVRVRKGARIFGTNNQDSIHALLDQLFNVTLNGKFDPQNLKGSIALIEGSDGIAPRNAIEGLLSVQMVGVHNLAMEYLKRAGLPNQTPEGIDANVHRAVRLLRTFTSQIEALNRNRGKISQQVVVGNVNVNDGGQAIVGSVESRNQGKAPSKNGTKKRR
jgi:hypothetical protein